jgi:hypothetical protein
MADRHRDDGRVLGPARNGGKLLTPWKPGQSGNPLGRNLSLKPVRELCRQKSMAAAESLIRIVEDVDENGRNNEDGRIVVVAAQTILTWAWGKPPDYDPNTERKPMSIDTSSLTATERAQMLAILRKGIIRESDQPGQAAAAPDTIEATPDK